MGFKNIHIILLICFAIILKLLFFSFALVLVQDNAKMDSLVANDAFKIRNKRRRITYSLLCAKENISNEEYIFAEKKETEDYNKLFIRFKLPILSFLTNYLSVNVMELKTNLSDFSETCFNSLSSKKHLSISILRI